MKHWKYDPGENPKMRHHWDKPYADFVDFRGEKVGKCPNNISNQEAERLLNGGITYSPPDWEFEYPNRIFVVYDGVVYRAKPTNPGISYHGFPESGKRLRKLPGHVKELIMAQARDRGCEQEVIRWFNR